MDTQTASHAQTAQDWLINRQAGPSKGGRNPHQSCLLEEKSDTASQANAYEAAVHSGCFTTTLNFLGLDQNQLHQNCLVSSEFISCFPQFEVVRPNLTYEVLKKEWRKLFIKTKLKY